jgi:hypothetical protein
MKKRINNNYIKVMLALFLFTSYSVYAQDVTKKVKGVTKAEDIKNLKFPKIKKYNVELECVSPIREFKAGQPAKMTFRLRNYSLKPLIIYEWYAKESENIRLYYIPWTPKMKKPKKDQWFSIIPKIAEKPKRLSMELTHRSSVLLDVDLSFIKEMKTDRIQSFIIFTELNLTSISARSQMIKIEVKP